MRKCERAWYGLALSALVIASGTHQVCAADGAEPATGVDSPATKPMGVVGASVVDARKLLGFWQGKINVGGQTLRVVLQLRAKYDGSLLGVLHSLDQDAFSLPAENITFKDGILSLTVMAVGGSFEGKISEDGKQFEGEWKQADMGFPLTVEHVTDIPEFARPQEPQKPYPYREEEVSYQNQAAGIKIGGTLTYPQGQGPFPAIILISNSTPEELMDRNAETKLHRPFLVLADYLTRRGLAVLRVDERSIGQSSGDGSLTTTEDRVGDVLAGIGYLKTRAEIDANKIGLLGHGSGGLVAPLCASQSKDVAFMVLLAAPGIPGEDWMLMTIQKQAEVHGGGKEAGLKGMEAFTEALDVIDAGEEEQVTEQKIREIMTRGIKSMVPVPDKPGKQADAINALIKNIVDNQVRQFMAPGFRSFVRSQPREVLLKVQCPVLALNGEADISIVAKHNLRAIETALRDGGNKDFTIKSLPKLNHQFQTSTTGTHRESAKNKETIAPAVLELIGDWVSERSKKQP